jgi:hypothetical protein
MSLDIFNPVISTVSHDMAGKTILVYGSNRTGKTKQLTRLPKPYYLAFEKGINGIAGIPFAPIQKWSDFVKINKQLTNPKTLEQAKQLYQTIVFDTAQAAGLMCEDFICQQYGVNRIKDGNNGYGLYREYATEFAKQINLLTSVGYTIAFISHEATRDFTDENGEEYTKIYPAGDKRVIDPICDLVDIIAYASVNGLDEEGNEIKSSLYMVNTKKYHAGSRFDYLPPYLKEFTAENLQNAIAEAIKKQEEADGIKTVDYAQFQKQYKTESLSFEQLQEKIRDIAIKLNEADRVEEYKDIVESHLGIGARVSEATKKQIQQMELILADLEMLDID